MSEMKLPGPDHPITVAFNPKRVQVDYNGHVIADSERALRLQEATYPAVLYIPREDVSMEYMSSTDHSTHCPYKGDASYFTILMDGRFAENAVWSYENPYPAMTEIKGYLAFYPNKVTIRELDDGASAEAIREAVEHTDLGSGNSQLDHWPATAETLPTDASLERPYKDTGAL